MAISSSTRKAGPFLGNGATTVFPFAFKVFTSADLRVVRTNALGIESDLVLDTDYTVTLNSDQDNDPGGSVTRATALPTGERLTITSDVEALQPLVLTNNGGFYPRVINDAFDKITIIAQQLIEQVGRSLKLPISSTASSTLPDPIPNGILAWNSAASGFVNIDPGTLVTVAAYADAFVSLFDGTGSQTNFTLSADPGVLANIDVSVSGVVQVGGEDYTFVGTTLVFTTAPPAGSRIQVRYTRALLPADLTAAVAAAEADRVATAADRVATAADRVQTGLDRVAASSSASAASSSASAAQTAETNAETAETAAEAAQAAASAYATSASASADTATLAALVQGIWPTATLYVPRGITGHGTITGGSGGTNGTFTGSVTGGNFSVNPTFTFTVSGGALTSITITGPGQYIGASPTSPTAVFTASAGLTGASATLTTDFLVAAGRTWWANHATDSLLYQLYQNAAGVATIQTGSTLVKAPTTNLTDVWLEYVPALSWETANKYFLRPTQNVSLTGTLTQYRFRWIAPFDCVTGSYNVHIVNYGVTPAADGTITAGQSVTGGGGVTTGDGGLVNVRATDGVSQIAVGEVAQYSALLMQRNPDPVVGYAGAAYTYHLIGGTDTITPAVAEANVARDYKTPKPSRPVHSLQVASNFSLIRVKLHEDHYSDITYANQGDHLKIGYMNVAPFMALTDDFLALNSMWGHMKNKDIEFGNFVYRALDSGTTVETGLVWSAFEAVLIIGDMADAADTANLGTNFQLAGRAHGHVVNPPTTTRKGYRKDSSTGTPTAATKTNPLTITVGTITSAQIGDRIKCSGAVGMTQINDVWLTITGRSEVGNTTVLTFSGVNATGYGTFTSCPNNIEWEKTGLGDAAINNEWAGTRIVQQASGELTVPDGTVACSFSDSTTFEQHEDYQILHEWALDFNDAVGITPGTRAGGYSTMCPLTGANRAVGYVNGVKGTVQVIDKRDGSNTSFGYAEKIVVWNVDDPEVQLVIENTAGAGYTHFEDGVGVAYAANVIGINNDYGTKLYWPIYPVSTPVSLAGKVLTGGARYKLVRGTPIT